jgi:RIO-like serine/threonine protein kinase
MHLGPLHMVVMDHVPGTHLEWAKEDEKPKDLHKQIKEIVHSLHDAGYVFGDLRPPNVMVSDRKALLVDFDWAGAYKEVHYPAGLGKGITDYCDATDFGIIEKDHDLSLLNHYFPIP